MFNVIWRAQYEGSRMSIWAKLFGRACPAAPRATAQQILSKRENVARALVSNDANKQLVRGSLERLEAAGLRIRPTLDRDLIVVRFLRSFADRYISEDLVTFFADDKGGGAKCSLDLTAFWELASETDAFDGFEEIDAVLPELSSMSDEVLSDRLDDHSYSVFENAVELSIVNEHGPGEYVRQHVEELADLACGDFEIQSITESDKSDRLVRYGDSAFNSWPAR